MPIFINKEEIQDDQILEEMRHYRGHSKKIAYYCAAEALVIRELLIQEAKGQKLLQSDTFSIEEEDEAIDKLIQQEVRVPEATTEDCARYYQKNQQSFTDRQSGDTRALADVVQQIAAFLHDQSLRLGISQYIQQLADKAHIVGFELEKR